MHHDINSAYLECAHAFLFDSLHYWQMCYENLHKSLSEHMKLLIFLCIFLHMLKMNDFLTEQIMRNTFQVHFWVDIKVSTPSR